MAMHVVFKENTYRIPDDFLPGNSTSDDPVEFDLEPAWGADLARIKSITYACIGVTQPGDWTPDTQQAVAAAFEHGAAGFIRTIREVRGLTVDPKVARRANLITNEQLAQLQKTQQPFRVSTGAHYAAICGTLIATSILVAKEIAVLTDGAERDMDPRFFKQPSGSGGTVTEEKTPAGPATTARRRTRGRGTVAGDSTNVESSANAGK